MPHPTFCFDATQVFHKRCAIFEQAVHAGCTAAFAAPGAVFVWAPRESTPFVRGLAIVVSLPPA